MRIIVNIKFENGKYVVDANIHTEIMTNDIAEVQDRFVSDCAYGFANEARDAFIMKAQVGRIKREDLDINGR